MTIEQYLALIALVNIMIVMSMVIGVAYAKPISRYEDVAVNIAAFSAVLAGMATTLLLFKVLVG